MRLFAAVVDAGGLAAGGRRVGLSPASVSERIAALETRSGARLLIRTTRAFSLTDEGRLYLDTARSVLAEIDDLETRLRDGADRISGRIRLGAPVDLGRNRIARLIDDFMDRHPDVAVELILSDGFGDLVGDGMDFALRYGALADSGLIARRLAPNRRLVCASPAYVETQGAPTTPSDLAHHKCLVMMFGDRPQNLWRFQENGRERIVKVTGRRIANDGDLVRRWAIEGRGVALKSLCDVAGDLEEGRLIELLADFAIAEGALQIVYPAGRPLPRRTRALIDAIAADFERADTGNKLG